ncbi:MAG TPA: glycosyltransferase family 2 protein [Lachnospiraceae bacterium]|nr:glycosyltransferase family 2 protein [Lachnospiraceae bacterium]HPF28517.1 glycosyltransferase family 2 protein [Lachnospiraceae bacterium]
MVHVSICIPAYNNTVSLERLLQSISMQTYHDYEVIITDDSTNDEVKELVENYDGLSILYEKNVKSLGPTANTNAAMKKANGELIKVMHHDDSFAHPLSLKNFVDMMDHHPKAVLAFSGTNEQVYLKSGEIDVEKSYTRCISDLEMAQLNDDYRNLFLVNMIGAPSATIFRNQKELFDEYLKWLVDVDFYMHILSNSMNYEYSKETLVNIGISQTQVTRSCLDDQQLIFDENRYVFLKFKLYESKVYRKSLIRMSIQMHQGFSMLRECHIPRREYQNHWMRMKIRAILR